MAQEGIRTVLLICRLCHQFLQKNVAKAFLKDYLVLLKQFWILSISEWNVYLVPKYVHIHRLGIWNRETNYSTGNSSFEFVRQWTWTCRCWLSDKILSASRYYKNIPNLIMLRYIQPFVLPVQTPLVAPLFAPSWC